ncbi:RNase H family protein [Pseudoclavibacter sp. 13-3]|uniref:RNase H family protein n=1 Tax=Pseudoclavibacter sp. 13-3 TaxID=2901228 RepID=UPI001E3696C0|nr:RNase H family protein [Pseudoclavibacter sp. 13-3]MCD7101588.1 hypothetical protein [Pseudoclavibacter sp. 13-3]
MRPKKTSAAGESITVYTDASFDPNEKRGVYGWVRPCPDGQQPDHWVGMRKAPSVNQLEVLAAIAAVMAHADAHDITLYTDSHAVIVAFEKATRSEAVKGVPSARVEALHEVLQHVSVDVRKVAAHTTDYWNNVVDRVVRAVMRRLEVDADQVHLPKQDVVQAALDEARRTSNETARKAERDAAEQAAKSAAAEAQQHELEKADRLAGLTSSMSEPGRTSEQASTLDLSPHGVRDASLAALPAELLAETAAELEVPDYLAPTSAGALSPLFGAGAEVAAELAAAGLGPESAGGADGHADAADAAVEPEETWADPFAVPVRAEHPVSVRSARAQSAGPQSTPAPAASQRAPISAVPAPAASIFDLLADAEVTADAELTFTPVETSLQNAEEPDVALFDIAGADAPSFDPDEFSPDEFEAEPSTATDFSIFSSETSAEQTVTYSSSAPAGRENDLLQHPASPRSNELGHPAGADVFSMPRSSDPFVLLDQLQLENQQLRHEHAVLREALEIMLRDRRG